MDKKIQLIDSKGGFHEGELNAFLRGMGVAGVDYSTVAIMGPQSSGKSTLLNALFGTDFKTMDADEGRRQTTQGVWLGAAPKIKERPTLVLDLEGSDGRERGEDDTTFERQSALFALATVDVLMINMFAVNIGRVQGAGAPLLKTIFQVNLKLFQIAPSTHRTVLVLVIRDRTRTPLSKLQADLRRDLDTIWASVVKPPEHDTTTLDDFFVLRYEALPSYELQEDMFVAEATLLRRRFLPEEDDNFLVEDENKVPSSALGLHLSRMWAIICDQKDLDLPAHKIMVANIRCKAIAKEQLAAISNDPVWTALLSEARAGDSLVPDFRERAQSLVQSCLYGYDSEALFFAESVRSEQRWELAQALYLQLRPAFDTQKALLQRRLEDEMRQTLAAAAEKKDRVSEAAALQRQSSMDDYAEYMVEHLVVVDANWGVAAEEMSEKLDAAFTACQAAALRDCEHVCADELEAAVDGPGWLIIQQLPNDLWLQLRGVVKTALKHVVSTADDKLMQYGVLKEQVDEMHERLATEFCTKLVKALRRHLKGLPRHLEEKFTAHFEQHNGKKRPWTSNKLEDAQRARNACGQALAQLAIVPTGFRVAAASPEDFQSCQESVLEFVAHQGALLPSGYSEKTPRLLTLPRWPPNVPPDAILLSPSEVRLVWLDFCKATQKQVDHAIELQEERKRARSSGVPLWFYVALLLLGWNELMSVVKRPIVLVVLALSLMFFAQLYRDLEVDRAMQSGLPAGAITIASKIIPTSRGIFVRTGKSIYDAVLLWTGKQSPSYERTDSSSSPGDIQLAPILSSPVEGLRRRNSVQSTDGHSGPIS